MSSRTDTRSRYVVEHSLGFLNIDPETIHFTKDGNWGNLRVTADSYATVTSLRGLERLLSRKPPKIIGVVLAVISLVLFSIAAYYFSLIFLFLAVATTYLTWASLRAAELEGISISRERIMEITDRAETVVLVIVTEEKEPLSLPLRKVSEKDREKLQNDFNTSRNG